jgi:hypothetical protein
VGACRRAGVEPKVEVIETPTGPEALISNVRLAVAAKGCAKGAA